MMKRFIILLLVFTLSCSVSFAIDLEEDDEPSYYELTPDQYGIVIEYLNEKYPDLRTIFDHRSDEIMVVYMVVRQLISVTDDFDVNASYTGTTDPIVAYYGYMTTKYDEPALLFFFQDPNLSWRMAVIIPSRPVISYTPCIGTTEAIDWVMPYMEKKCGNYMTSISVRDLLLSDQMVLNIINGQ